MRSLFFILTLTLVVSYSNGAIFRNTRAEGDKDWWETAVFYQIYPRSFQDSDGDGVGDLRGIIDRLDHLKELGVGGTWLSPIFTSPMVDFGYDIADFYDIEPTFGNMTDFEDLLEKANELDIKIILDFVPNHSSSECEWFIESLDKNSDKADWYIWEDPKGYDEDGKPIPPNNWVSVFRFSAWEWNEERQQFYFHQFAKEQPDLNYRNPAVVEEMKNVLRFWLEKGVAGFRIDAINHLFEVSKDDFNGTYPDEPLTGYLDQGPDDYGYVDHIYTKDLKETYWMVYEWRKIFDEFTERDGYTRVIMTEAYTDDKSVMDFYGNETSIGSHMPFNFNLINQANAESTARDVKRATDSWLTYMPLDKTPNWVIGNHDQWRVATRYGRERIDGLNMMVLLLPGVGITYYGEEIGMENTHISWEDTKDPQACNTQDPDNYWKSSRDPARTPFQWDDSENAGFSTNSDTWLPINENYVDLNLEAQKEEPRSHFNIYKNLMKLRSLPAFMHGKYQSLALTEYVFAFKRYLEGEDSYVVVMNLGESNTTVNVNFFDSISENLEVIEASYYSDKEIESTVSSAELHLEPYEALVLKSGATKLIVASSLLLWMLILNKLFN